MATKWKSRAMRMVWILLLAFGLTWTFTGLNHSSMYMEGNYFHSMQFENEVHHFVELLTTVELSGLSKEEAKEHIVVTKEDIEEHRYRYGDLEGQISNIRAQYEQRIADAEASGTKEAAAVYAAERDKKIADITKNFEDDEYVRPKVLAEKEAKVDEFYEQSEQYQAELASYKTSYLYYFTDNADSRVYTNMRSAENAEKTIKGKDYLFIKQYPETGMNNSLGGYHIYTEHMDVMQPILEKQLKGVRGYVLVASDADPQSPVMQNYQRYVFERNFFWISSGAGFAALLLALYWNKRLLVLDSLAPKSWRAVYARIPLDLCLGLLGASAAVTLVYLTEQSILSIPENWYGYAEMMLGDLIGAAAFLALVLLQWKLLRERLPSITAWKTERKSALLYRAYEFTKQAFLVRSIGTQVVMLAILLFLTGSSAIFVALDDAFIVLYGILCIVIGIPAGILILKQTGYLNRIIVSTSELAAGNHGKDVPVKGASVLAKLASNINTLKNDVKLSQREQAKSERLKTELITNVSHDLRTPLTSVITYTELLKTPDLSVEEQAAYVEIIDRKSKRLKVLIDDLFEATKMASGNIELVKERVDLVQLLQQALAEHDEMIQASTLQFRVTHSRPNLYVTVDGPKLWRVFENVIGNILKYSLENTRVYISAVKDGDKAVLTFKNVSKYELGGSTDELLERFKRGDTSRHTDGSGLGLAIAKSIVDLHDGGFEIEADGDLFKVTVTLYGAE